MRRPKSLWPSSSSAVMMSLASSLFALWGCSSGGYVSATDLAGHAPDLAQAGDSGSPGDASAPPDLATTSDMALPINSWTFFGKQFQGSTPSCLQVMSWWAVTVNASAPYFCSLDIFFTAKPTHDAIYAASDSAPPGLPADRAMIVITDERTGGVEQWDGIEMGQVAVHVAGSALTFNLQNMVVRGAVNVPKEVPNQPVWGTILCP